MNKKIVGGLELLLASALYGSYGIFYRYISEFGNFAQGWVRSLIIVLILVVIISLNKDKWRKYNRKDLPWFALWIIPSSFLPIVTFLAFNNLPVGLVYFLMYASIVITSFISGIIFFKERINLTKGLALLSVIIGIFFIYWKNIDFISNVYVLLALFAGAQIGFWNTLTKKISDKYSEEQMILTDNFSVIIIGLLLTLIFNEPLPINTSSEAWLWMIIFSIISLMTGVLIVRGFNKLEAQVGSLIVPMEIIFGSIFGYIFFKESLSLNIYIGGFFIFLSAIIPYLKELFFKK